MPREIMKVAKAKPEYALDLGGVVSFLADRIDEANGTPLSIRQLALTYRHVSGGDFTRVKFHEGATTDYEAKVWLLEEAGRVMGKSLVMTKVDDGDTLIGYAPGKNFEDLRWNRKKVRHTELDIHAKFNDAFNHLGGRFTENIRTDTTDDLTELTASLRAFGWIAEFPAIKDEFGVVLIGHRRLRVAAELKIDPVVKVLKLGKGDAADVERFKLAIASNIGGRPLSGKDKREIAIHLYKNHRYTMDQVGEALSISQQRVSEFLQGTGKNDARGRPTKEETKARAEKIRKSRREGWARGAVSMPPDKWKVVGALAKKRGLSRQVLLGEWLIERIEVEVRGDNAEG